MNTGWLRILPQALACTLLLAAATRAATPHAAKPAPATATATIDLKAFMFAPTPLTITAGTRVKWKNSDPEPHTVVSVDGKFRSGALDTDDTFEFTFDAPGTYRYVCSIHPQMVGTIVVTAAGH